MKASIRLKQAASHVHVRWLTLVLGAWLGSGGCSTTTTLTPQAPAQVAAIPDYTYLSHPRGTAVSDVKLLFTQKDAPKPETLAQCDADFRTLYQKVASTEERTRGVHELVVKNPAGFHWCFYSKVLELDDGLATDEYIDEKQKRIMTTYEFLVPVARAFMAEFRDSRYLRWAIRDYRRLANAYFYRSLEISPQTSAQLVDVGDPFSVSPGYTNPTGSAESVLEKYKITPAAPIAVPVAKKEAPVPQIATATPSPVPSAAPPAAAPASVDDAVADTVTDAKANDTMEYAKQLSKQHEEVSPPAEAPVKADAQANPDRYPATTSEGLPPMPDALPVTPAAK